MRSQGFVKIRQPRPALLCIRNFLSNPQISYPSALFFQPLLKVFNGIYSKEFSCFFRKRRNANSGKEGFGKEEERLSDNAQNFSQFWLDLFV